MVYHRIILWYIIVLVYMYIIMCVLLMKVFNYQTSSIFMHMHVKSISSYVATYWNVLSLVVTTHMLYILALAMFEF